MPGSNVQLIRDAVEAMAQGDIARLSSMVAPRGELRPLRAQLERTDYFGPDGARRLFQDLRSEWEDLEFDYAEIHEEGSTVVLVGQLRARARASGVDVDTTIGWRFVVEDNLIAFAAAHSDPAVALSESDLTGGTEAAIATVRRHYEAFDSGDLDAILATLDPEVDIYGGDERAGGASERFRGVEEAREFFADIKRLVPDSHIEVLTLEAVPERVIASIRLHGSAREGEVSGSIPAVHFHSLRDGLITRIETYRPDWRRELERA